MKNLFTTICLLASIQAFSQASDSSVYFYQKGVEEKAARRFLVASGYFDRAIQLNPKYTASYLENGYVDIEMRKTDAARLNFTKVVQLEPENMAAVKELMELAYSYHQYADAVNFAKKCPTCDNAERITAMSYFQQEDYPSAEKIFLSILTKNPNDAEVTYTLGRTYLEEELDTKAIPYYEKAVKLDTSRNSWLFELALLYYSGDNYQNAAIYFNKAADQGYPRSNDFNEDLGYSYIYSGQFDKGEKLLLEIQARKPGNTDIFRDIAEAYYQRKLYDKSLEFCQKLLELNDKDGKALYQAGLCFQKKGQTDRGQQMCDRAIELDPSLNHLRQKKMTAGL